MTEYLDTFATGGIVIILIGVIYKTLVGKIKDLAEKKVDITVCHVVREQESKELNYIRCQLDKIWDELRDNTRVLIEEIKKNGGQH